MVVLGLRPWPWLCFEAPLPAHQSAHPNSRNEEQTQTLRLPSRSFCLRACVSLSSRASHRSATWWSEVLMPRCHRQFIRVFCPVAAGEGEASRTHRAAPPPVPEALGCPGARGLAQFDLYSPLNDFTSIVTSLESAGLS